MTVGPSGKHMTIRALRPCAKCKSSTQHLCYGIRYEKPEPTTESYVKHMFWTCQTCGEPSEELREVPEPTERTMLTQRLLRVGEDYDVKSVSIQSEANAVTLRIEFPDYDPARLRRLAFKLEEGYINVGELMELHKAGFRNQEDREKLLMRPMRHRRRENIRRAIFGTNIGW